mmetsp:Transcript_41215/g.87270  ORF Transcript_41215/g.87270 Transcript_41215/m.87270 type:complete len:128 (-) Transcript_41215:450-833(-)
MSSTWTLCAAVAGLTAAVAVQQKRSVATDSAQISDEESCPEPERLMSRKFSSTYSECYASTVCPSEHFDLTDEDLDEEDFASSSGEGVEFFSLDDEDEVDPYELDDAMWAAFSLPGKSGCGVGLLQQ